MPQSKASLIRSYFDAYKRKDREFIENALTDDFTFTSPYDDAIDKATYFERCWPNSETIREYEIEKIFEEGEEAFALYRAATTDGKEFRNTEFFRFRGDRLASVEVFFGATYRHGRFVPGQ
jgi:ketosteroid isomerase-like protein